MPQTQSMQDRTAAEQAAFERVNSARKRLAEVAPRMHADDLGATINDKGQPSMTLPLSLVEKLLER